MKKYALLALALAAGGMMLFAGGSGARAAPAQARRAARPYAGVHLKWIRDQAVAQNQEAVELINMVWEKTGIVIEPAFIPAGAEGQAEKALLMIMAGDEFDILYHSTPNLKKYYNAGALSDVGELAAKAGYDIKKIYGGYLPVFNGRVYGLPAFSDIWLTLYNKSMFDKAGIPYPSPAGWTWEKYIETAKKFSDPSKKIYGSLMLDYDNYNYMYAVQSGASHYNARGLSNYGDPLFRRGLEFFYGLGNTEKIQPPIQEFRANGIPWNAFFTQKAEYAMFVCGGWTLSLLSESSRFRYPRNWKFGILPMPYPEGMPPSTFTASGCYAIPATSKNREAALAAIAVIAENQYTLGYGRIPARQDLTGEEIDSYIETGLLKNYAADGITPAEIRAAWFDPGRIILPEKITGPGDAEINQVWVEEGRIYGLGQKSLDAAMEAIHTRSDHAVRQSRL